MNRSSQNEGGDVKMMKKVVTMFAQKFFNLIRKEGENYRRRLISIEIKFAWDRR